MPPKLIPAPAPAPALRADAARLEKLLGAIGEPSEASTQDLKDVVALAFGFNRCELAKEVLDSSVLRHLQTRNGPVEVPEGIAGLVTTWLQRRGGPPYARLPAWPARLLLHWYWPSRPYDSLHSAGCTLLTTGYGLEEGYQPVLVPLLFVLLRRASTLAFVL